MWGDVIGPALTGLAGVITAIAGLRATRRQASGDELKWCEEDRAHDQAALLAALRHVWTLERALAAAGLSPPPRPEALRA